MAGRMDNLFGQSISRLRVANSDLSRSQIAIVGMLSRQKRQITLSEGIKGSQLPSSLILLKDDAIASIAPFTLGAFEQHRNSSCSGAADADKPVACVAPR